MRGAARSLALLLLLALSLATCEAIRDRQQTSLRASSFFGDAAQEVKRAVAAVAAEARTVASSLESALASEQGLAEAFEAWRAQYGVHIRPAELRHRLAVFRRNLQTMLKHNRVPGTTWVAAPNAFAHLTFEEFTAQRLGMAAPPLPAPPTPGRRLRQAGARQPPSVDWVRRGKVTPVKDQGSCGSCWAFAATAALESRLLINGGGRLDLSEQELVDCANRAHGLRSYGCDGGLPQDAFDFAHRFGQASARAYGPYTARDGACRMANMTRAAAGGARITGQPSHTTVPPYSASALQRAVAAQPVVATLWVDEALMHYRSGVFQGATCLNNSVNHAVLAVGYDTTGPEPYWLIKNSWGRQWGEGGYFKIRMAQDFTTGTCGMYLLAVAPAAAERVTDAVPAPAQLRAQNGAEEAYCERAVDPADPNRPCSGTADV